MASRYERLQAKCCEVTLDFVSVEAAHQVRLFCPSTPDSLKASLVDCGIAMRRVVLSSVEPRRARQFRWWCIQLRRMMLCLWKLVECLLLGILVRHQLGCLSWRCGPEFGWASILVILNRWRYRICRRWSITSPPSAKE